MMGAQTKANEHPITIEDDNSINLSDRNSISDKMDNEDNVRRDNTDEGDGDDGDKDDEVGEGDEYYVDDDDDDDDDEGSEDDEDQDDGNKNVKDDDADGDSGGNDDGNNQDRNVQLRSYVKLEDASAASRVEGFHLIRVPLFNRDAAGYQSKLNLQQYASMHPTSLQLPFPQSAQMNVRVPPIEVPSLLRFVVVPKFFVQATDPCYELDKFDTQLDPASSSTVISVKATDFNTTVMAQACFGFTPGTAPFFRNRLRKAAEQPPRTAAASSFSVARSEPPPPLPPSLSLSMEGDDKQPDEWRLAAGGVQRAVVTLNLYALSLIMDDIRAWTFTLSVESSPYYGAAGVQLRLLIYAADEYKFHSVHVFGVADHRRDSQHASDILSAMCPRLTDKLLGVVAPLRGETAHKGLEGAVASFIIGHFIRLTPRHPPLVTPDIVAAQQRPPLLPKEIASASSSVITILVEHYRPRLQLSWDAPAIARILTNYTALCLEMSASCNENFLVDKADWNTFTDEWAPYCTRFDALFHFVAGLATTFLYRPQQDVVNVSITCLDTAGTNQIANRIATDIVLHFRQFMQLRPIWFKKIRGL